MELQIENLSKRYGTRWGVRNVFLRSGPGLLGLVGPNGAGKTTILRMVATLVPPTQGSIRWNGLDSQRDSVAIRRVLGYLPQEFGVYSEFTARQFLRYLAAMKGLPTNLADHRVDEALELVNLEREADRRLRTYSGGMRQRVGIAQAFLNDPELLIVDEPTAGLDPAERVRFRTLLANLTHDRLVILSTHIVGDVEAVASRLILLRDGEVVADTTPDVLLARAAGRVWSVLADSATALSLQATHPVSAFVVHPQGTAVRVLSEHRPHPEAVPAEPTLEDAYPLEVGVERKPSATLETSVK